MRPNNVYAGILFFEALGVATDFDGGFPLKAETFTEMRTG